MDSSSCVFVFRFKSSIVFMIFGSSARHAELYSIYSRFTVQSRDRIKINLDHSDFDFERSSLIRKR